MSGQELFEVIESTKGAALAAVRKYLSPEHLFAIDDVIQETYLRVYTGMKNARFADAADMRNWVFTIAKNESVRMNVKMAREEKKVRRAGLAAETESGKSPFPGEEIFELRRAIDELPGRYREIFLLLVQGFPESEIARKLSIRPGTVKSRIHRGRERIRRSFTERGLRYEENI